MDIFLWGYLKEKVFRNAFVQLTQLKWNVEVEISCISAAIIKQVAAKMKKCVDACIVVQEDTEHFL